jgi:hypothetical protein
VRRLAGEIDELDGLVNNAGIISPERRESPVDGRDVIVNALHPATFMDTKMVTGGGGRPQSSVEEGAAATLRLVADPDVDGESGRFFDGVWESGTHRQANDPEARRRLWDVSERLTGLA